MIQINPIFPPFFPRNNIQIESFLHNLKKKKEASSDFHLYNKRRRNRKEKKREKTQT